MKRHEQVTAIFHFEKQGRWGMNFTFHLNFKRKRRVRRSVGENWFLVPDFYDLDSLDDWVQLPLFLQRTEADKDSAMYRNDVPWHALSVVR